MSTAPLLSLFFVFWFAFNLLLGSNQPYILHSQKKQHISHHQSLNKFLDFWGKKIHTPPNNLYSLPCFSTMDVDHCSCHLCPQKAVSLKANSIQSPFSCFMPCSFALKTLGLASVMDWKYSSAQGWDIDTAWAVSNFELGIYIKCWHYRLVGGQGKMEPKII